MSFRPEPPAPSRTSTTGARRRAASPSRRAARAGWRGRLKRGYTMVEIMIVVLIMSIMLAIAAPNLRVARDRSRQKACINNLKLIDGAKEMYALQNRTATGATIQLTWLIGTYIKGPSFGSSSPESMAAEFRCPSSGAMYGPTMGAVGTPPICPTASARTGTYAHVLP